MRPRVEAKILLPAGVVLILLLCLALFASAGSARKEHARLAAKEAEILQLKDEFVSLKRRVDAVEGRKGIANVDGVVQAVDEIFRSLGLDKKVKSVKSAGAREKVYGSEEDADVQVEKVSMNEMVNIYFRIENAPMILTVRKTTMKTAFDNPSLLNVTMTVSLIRPK